MFIGFPVVDPAPGGEPLGVARVSTAPSNNDLSPLPHERFAVDNAWNAWSRLYPQTHWPASLFWEPLSLYGGECWLEPEQWHGSSANFATLLAMTLDNSSVQQKRLLTEHLWATGLLGVEGGAVQLRRVNHITSKVHTFVRYCELHPETTAGAVFFLPATCVQKLQPLLDGGLEVEHCFFDPSLSALPERTQPLLCFVKINQVEPLLRWLQTSAVFELWKRSRWLLLAAVCLLVALGSWFSFAPFQRSSRTSAQTPFQVPAQRKSRPRIQRKVVTAKVPLKRTPSVSSALRNLTVSVKPEPPRKRKAIRKRVRARISVKRPSPFWRVELLPAGYGRRYRWFLEGVKGVRRTDKALLIPRSTRRSTLRIVLAYATATQNFAPCKLRLDFTTTRRLYLKPLTPVSQTTRDDSYCRRKP